MSEIKAIYKGRYPANLTKLKSKKKLIQPGEVFDCPAEYFGELCLHHNKKEKKEGDRVVRKARVVFAVADEKDLEAGKRAESKAIANAQAAKNGK